MTGRSPDVVHTLMVQSLRVWHVAGDVERLADGALLLTAGETKLRITRAGDALPFRWMVGHGDRMRGATSIAGLLRVVRTAVDPGYRPGRLRIAPLPAISA